LLLCVFVILFVWSCSQQTYDLVIHNGKLAPRVSSDSAINQDLRFSSRVGNLDDKVGKSRLKFFKVVASPEGGADEAGLIPQFRLFDQTAFI